MTPTFDSLVALLEHRGTIQAGKRAYTFLLDGEQEGSVLTYGELLTQAHAIAATLRERGVLPGDRALLLYNPGIEFIAAFFGCLCAGVIAVPAYPPNSAQMSRAFPRLVAVAGDADVAIVLCTEKIAQAAPDLAQHAPGFAALPWLATDLIPDTAAIAWRDPGAGSDTLAFLQYTSGSTAAPKGVMVSHGNLLHNLGYLDCLAENDEDSVAVSWLPVIHDMGLIEGVLQPIYAGYPAVLMAPEAFLQRPIRWLEAITRYRGTNSGGPNFAFDLCVRRINTQQVAALDLSSWRCAYNGAEPIRAETLSRFLDAFKPAGFRATSLFPVYGLAESTLIVTGGRRCDAPMHIDADATALTHGSIVEPGLAERRVAIVGCGAAWCDTKLRIVDPDTFEMREPGQVGEIWIASPSVTRGYWRKPALSDLTFGAHLSDGTGPWLRSGDLGALHNGQLVVTGRLKDLIIVRGAKHYPQDLELTAEQQHRAVRAGCAAAFGILGADGEAAAIAAEIDPRQLRTACAIDAQETLAGIVSAIREAVAERHGIQLQAVALLALGGMPKTTSGKLQRRACRSAFEAGKLDELHRWTHSRVGSHAPARPVHHLVAATGS